MPQPQIATTLSRTQLDAILFDLDGVVTCTARGHATAWKAMFDDYLRERAAREGEGRAPFDLERDYRRYVDGRPRVPWSAPAATASISMGRTCAWNSPRPWTPSTTWTRRSSSWTRG